MVHTPQIYIRSVWVIKSPTVIHSVFTRVNNKRGFLVLHWDLLLLAKHHTFAFEISEKVITTFKRVKRL